MPGYSLTQDGLKVSDEQISEWLYELVCGDGFPYGYRKLTVCLQEDYGLRINHKKVYRLCKELDILRPQRRVARRHPRHLARRTEVSGPNQLWEMDVKYGYIQGTNQFFFQLSLIDVFDRMIVDYHLGLSCKTVDACRVLEESLKRRGLTEGMDLPRIRTDNGPQFVANRFQELCEGLDIIHERIPVKTPNMNAHIESFHAILEDECYSRHEFSNFAQVYTVIADYMGYYNNRRRHGSLCYMAPESFHKAFESKTTIKRSFVA